MVKKINKTHFFYVLYADKNNFFDQSECTGSFLPIYYNIFYDSHQTAQGRLPALIIAELFNASGQVDLNNNSIAATTVVSDHLVLFLFSLQVCRASLVKIKF